MNGQYNGSGVRERNGGSQRLCKASHYFRLAAEQNDAGAQYNLGVMYNGEGVQKDPLSPTRGSMQRRKTVSRAAAAFCDEVAKAVSADQMKQVKIVRSRTY